MIKFTKEEKTALIFLALLLSIGIGISYYKRSNPRTFELREFDEEELAKKININTAGKEELVKLKNIGPSLAEKIVLYRDEHGPFKNTEDLKNIKGIKDKLYEKIKKQITLQ